MLAVMLGVILLNSASLPQGPGLAQRYPGDRGIGSDPSVVLAEDFEAGTLRDVLERWDEVSNQDGAVLALVGDSVPNSHGRSVLQVTATVPKNTGGHLYTRLRRPLETAFARFYVKFEEDPGYIHHFVTIGGYNPPTRWPQGGAGQLPAGHERMTVGVEPTGLDGGVPAPGIWNFYAYWQEMRISADGRYWGQSIYAEPPLRVPRGRWQCVEIMMKCNSAPERSDGELALWLDGKLAMHVAPGVRRGEWDGRGFNLPTSGGTPFEGFRWRSTRDLKINFFWLLHYVTESSNARNRDTRERNRVWFDHIVVAEKYIGPLQPATAQP